MITWWPVGFTGERDRHGRVQIYEAEIDGHTVRRSRRPGAYVSRFTVGTAEFDSLEAVLRSLR